MSWASWLFKVWSHDSWPQAQFEVGQTESWWEETESAPLFRLLTRRSGHKREQRLRWPTGLAA